MATCPECDAEIEIDRDDLEEMEAGDPSVSLDLLIRSLLALGASSRELGRTISARSPLDAR